MIDFYKVDVASAVPEIAPKDNPVCHVSAHWFEKQPTLLPSLSHARDPTVQICMILICGRCDTDP